MLVAGDRVDRGIGRTTGADFASLLTDAMNTQTASGIGGTGRRPATGGATGSAAPLSSLRVEPHRSGRRDRRDDRPTSRR